MNQSVLIQKGFQAESYLHDVPVFTIGNGVFGIRGFYEEDHEGIGGLGGIYMAGVFGKGSYNPWVGSPRELANIPNVFNVHILLNHEEVLIAEESVCEAEHCLNMHDSVYTRSYIYKKDGNPTARLHFTRFAAIDEPNCLGQRVEIESLIDHLEAEVHCDINAEITNLNEVSSEPWPVQPGKRHFKTLHKDAHLTETSISEPEQIELSFYQTVESNGIQADKAEDIAVNKILHLHEKLEIKKLVAAACSINDADVKEALQKRAENILTYDERLERSAEAMHRKWENSDIVIEGDEKRQLTLRYNIYQLMQSCPEHNADYSIGARGLTGEMYEGCVFWDTEIFMLPFFTCTRPDAARKLLHFRYKTLNQAIEHAKRNWFKGAMYGWQVNYRGEEQTPLGVGAYYSIHVIADIAYSILDYWNWTHDEKYILDEGLEILIETARFWASRVTQREDGQYDINAVRGPNEYDVIVNNNLYTNMMARENFILTRNLTEEFSKKHPEQLKDLFAKLNYTAEEEKEFRSIEEHIVLPYDAEKDLYLEDDTYLRRKKLDMKEAKPSGKRIIDTTIPYEGLPFYQVSKQADVLHVMKNLPKYFTSEQIQTAFDFYLPKTAFDSSLSYSMFALMAARLNRMEMAGSFYEKTSSLDIENVQLNTISGLHFANFGGTWQSIVFGFGGISIREDGIAVDPHLAEGFDKLSFHLFYRGQNLSVQIDKNKAEISCPACSEEIMIYGNREKMLLNKENSTVILHLN